jgi:hypothetical protein
VQPEQVRDDLACQPLSLLLPIPYSSFKSLNAMLMIEESLSTLSILPFDGPVI